MKKEYLDILKHTKKSPNRAFCADISDEKINYLLTGGFLRGPITAGFLPKTAAYFKLTKKGLNMLRGVK